MSDVALAAGRSSARARPGDAPAHRLPPCGADTRPLYVRCVPRRALCCRASAGYKGLESEGPLLLPARAPKAVRLGQTPFSTAMLHFNGELNSPSRHMGPYLPGHRLSRIHGHAF